MMWHWNRLRPVTGVYGIVTRAAGKDTVVAFNRQYAAALPMEGVWEIRFRFHNVGWARPPERVIIAPAAYLTDLTHKHRCWHSAVTIQRAWRRVIVDPEMAVCRARLRREFGELGL